MIRLLGILIILLTLHTVHATPKTDLMQISRAIKVAEKRDREIQDILKKLQAETDGLLKDILDSRYEATRQTHAYLALRHDPNQLSFLRRDQSIFDRFYALRHQQSKAQILESLLAKQAARILEMEGKQAAITTYLEERRLLALTVDSALQQITVLQTQRQTPDAALTEQIAKLRAKHETLEDFLQELLNIRTLPEPRYDDPLSFALPVSGVISQSDQILEITASYNALVTAPARGRVLYAADFGRLGLVLIIAHGQGYLSILQGMGELYVTEGFEVIQGEPVGRMRPQENFSGDVKPSVLSYRLRYNGGFINPMTMMTGL